MSFKEGSTQSTVLITIINLIHVLGIEKLFDDEDLVLKKEDEVSAVPVKVEYNLLVFGVDHFYST